MLKKGKNLLLPKPGKDKTIPFNYRPITLLEPIAKVFEKIINARLRTHLEDTHQFNKNQYRFRAGRSIQDVIFYTSAFIKKTPYNKQPESSNYLSGCGKSIRHGMVEWVNI